MLRAKALALWTLLAICHHRVTGFDATEGVTSFVTTAATSDATPVWLVLPLLLDIQPALLKLNVRRHVPAQLQNFCREHGMEVTRCADTIRQALDEVVNLQRFCKEKTAEDMPGFVVAKNVLREDGGPTASWMQNDPEDIALDLCTFVQHVDSDECVAALENALRRSFEWMLALTPCDDSWTEGTSDGVSSEAETTISERLVTIEQMIAALKQAPLQEYEGTSSRPEEAATEIADAGLFCESSAVEEISESEEPTTDLELAVDSTGIGVDSEKQVVEDIEEPSDDTCVPEVYGQPGESEDITVAYDTVAEEKEALRLEEGNVDDTQNEDMECLVDDLEGMCASGIDDQLNKLEESTLSLHEELENALATEELVSADTTIWDQASDIQDVRSTSETIVTETVNISCEAVYPNIFDEKLNRIGEELQYHQTWKIALTLLLALSIVYVVIDILMTCLLHAIWVPKQLIGLILHIVSLLIHGVPQSTLSKDERRSTFHVPEEPPAPLQTEQPIASEDVNSSEVETGGGGIVAETSSVVAALDESAEIPVQPHLVAQTVIEEESAIMQLQQELAGESSSEAQDREVEVDTTNNTSTQEEPTEMHEPPPAENAIDINDQAALEELVVEQVEVMSVEPAVETDSIQDTEPVSSAPTQVETMRENRHAPTVSSLLSTSYRALPSTSFTCLAMVLMVGSHTPVCQKRGSSPHATVSSFSLSGSVVMKIIRQRNQRERAAVQRIQRAWKANRHHHASDQEPVSRVTLSPLLDEVLRSKIRTRAPVFRLLQMRSKMKAQTPHVVKSEPGFHHLKPNVLPPL